MRVLIFCNSTAWGGLETHAANFAEFLADTGHDTAIVCLGDPPYQLFERASPKGVSILKLEPPRRQTVWNWLRVLGNVPADAAVLEKGTLQTGGLALDWALKLKYHRYITVQQLEPPVLPARSSRRYLGGLIPGIGLWWYRRRWSGYARSIAPAVTVCVSDSVRDRLATDYGFSARKLLTIQNGVDVSRYRDDPEARREARAAWGVPDSATVFASVGRFSTQKALDVAIEAFTRVVRANPERDVFLALVGDGTERAALVDQARRSGLERQIVFPGFMADPRAAYQGLDFFLIPSRYEGLPFALVEAMASGCRVIGTRVGGIPEVITDESMGVLVPPDDPAALADAMSSALRRDRQHRDAERAAVRQRVLEGFDFRTQSARMASLLHPPGGLARALHSVRSSCP